MVVRRLPAGKPGTTNGPGHAGPVAQVSLRAAYACRAVFLAVFRVVFLAVLRVVCLAVCRAAFRFVTRVAAARVDLDVPLAGALGFTFLVAIDGHLLR
jgi:hypothetical protein